MAKCASPSEIRTRNRPCIAVDQAPLTLSMKGKGAEITFEGKTKDGIQLRVTAKCLDVEKM